MSIPGQIPSFDRAVVVVTGAAAGIGRAAAQAFAERGARVVLIDVDEAGLAEAVAEIEQAGGQAIAIRASVADEAEVLAAAEAVRQRHGRCDLLVNNAGILLRGRIDAADASQHWRRTIEVNLSGCFYTSRAFLDLLRGVPGCIVNVASVHSLVAVENSAAYTASKGGVKQLTQAMALEFAPMGIRVNAVAPGSIATAMTAPGRDLALAKSAFMQRVPLARIGQPQDVVNAIQFLGSELAAYITGVTLPVDGGYVAA